MKFLSTIAAASSSLFISFSAQAVLQPAGTFVPAQCGVPTSATTKQSNIQSVCIGTVVAQTGRAVEFRMKDNSVHVFSVVAQSNLFMALLNGNVKAMYQLASQIGDSATMKVIQTHAGVVTSVSGELNNEQYFVPKMETMFVIQ